MTPIRRSSSFTLSIFVLACALPARPQNAPVKPNIPAAQPDYSREPSIIEQFDVVYRYAADGTGSKEMTVVFRLQDASAIKSLSVLDFPFASSAEHVEIDYIRVRRADGTVVETPAADAQEMPTEITREAPFYSDLKEKQVPVRSLRAGDHLEYKVRIVRTKPEAPGHFWGEQNFFVATGGAVVLEQSAELHFPKASYVQVWSPKYQSELTETATERVYTWHAAQLQPIAGLSKPALHDILAADPPDPEGNLPHIAWTNFHDWAEVGAWYRSMEGTRMAPDDDIRAKAAELTAGKQTPEEKVRAIYGYVGPQIRYIGVAFGVGRYQPHEAGDVLRNQYGDCKDKHTLLAALLSAAGFNSDAALIGAGIRFNEAVPSPGSFNHVITVVQLDGKPIWLDATAEVAPYRLLTSTIRDKQALLVPANGPSHIERTPKDRPFPDEVHFDAVGTLDATGTSNSHMVLVLRGDEEVPFRSAVRSVAPSQWDDLMQNISRRMSFGGTVTHAEFSRADDTAEPFRIAYDYEREKNGDWDNLRILPQVMPFGLGPVDEKDLPVSPIELGTPHVEVDHAVLTLPAGWGAELPPAVHAKSAFATLDKTYKLDDGKLITDRRIQVLKERIPATDWRAYKAWYEEAKLDGEPYIQLTQTSSGRTTASEDSQAAAFVSQAIALMQNHRLDEARKTLDKAWAINPLEVYLWSTYGYVAASQNKLEEAVRDFQRELVSTPDNKTVLIAMARVQFAQGKPQDSIATLRKVVALSPEGDEVTGMLASMLFNVKDYRGAEEITRTRLAKHPDDVTAQLKLSDILLREDKKSEAAGILKEVAEKSTDALMLNNAAYSLADENLDLPTAEQAARHSLAVMEEQIAAAPSAEPGTKALQRTEMVIDIWDTLAWTLYREGKAAEAEPFAQAAWANGLSADAGYHLGMILEKEAQPVKAMAIYQVALFGDRGNTPEVTAEANIARQAALREAGTKKQVEDGKMALQNQRTFKIPAPNVTTGSGTVEIEFSTEGASHARVVKDIQNSAALYVTLQRLEHVEFNTSIPTGSKAKLIRRGILSCHSGTPCEFVLLSSQSALSQ